MPPIGTIALSILLTATLLGCAGTDDDAASNEQIQNLEATVQSLQESLASLENDNADLKDEIAMLQQELEDADSMLESALSDKDQWSKNEQWSKADEWSNDKSDKLSLQDGAVVESTARLVEEAAGAAYYIVHPERGYSTHIHPGFENRTVLVTPQSFVNGHTPLIVSLHGYGSNSADHAVYFPLHERVNTDGFALLIPNGWINSMGYQFWNPTDECCDGGKHGEDDVAYLTELLAEVEKLYEFDPIYFFGYSNGGFMAYHMACKGLPGLRAVASLAGTSYVEESSCEGAPPVSVLHIHGTEDSVIRFDGDATESASKSGRETAFYASARDMVTRWSQLASCEWPNNPTSYAAIDFDQYVPGAETQAFRLEPGCADGISIELWVGEGSNHSPDYGEVFMDSLVEWLLSQE